MHGKDILVSSGNESRELKEEILGFLCREVSEQPSVAGLILDKCMIKTIHSNIKERPGSNVVWQTLERSGKTLKLLGFPPIVCKDTGIIFGTMACPSERPV